MNHNKHSTHLATGFKPRLAAFVSLIITMAAAPSLSVDAFAAVIVPSFLKAGFKDGILAKLMLWT